MFYDSKSFRAMESGLHASWLQQQTALHNLANVETPNYKSKAVVFEDTLGAAMAGNPNGPYSFKTSIVTENDTIARPDGNNVDSDAEGVVLFKAYAQYSYLTQKINGQFSNFRYVLTNAFK